MAIAAAGKMPTFEDATFNLKSKFEIFAFQIPNHMKRMYSFVPARAFF